MSILSLFSHLAASIFIPISNLSLKSYCLCATYDFSQMYSCISDHFTAKEFSTLRTSWILHTSELAIRSVLQLQTARFFASPLSLPRRVNIASYLRSSGCMGWSRAKVWEWNVHVKEVTYLCVYIHILALYLIWLLATSLWVSTAMVDCMATETSQELLCSLEWLSQLVMSTVGCWGLDARSVGTPLQ